MNVFEAVRVGGVELPNRLLMAPVKTGLGGTDGSVNNELLAYYRRRAEGGVGAIIVEPMYVDSAGKEHPRQLAIDGEGAVGGLSRLAQTIHDGGAKAIAHLNHAGRAANPKATGGAPEAPSEVACPTTGAVPLALASDRIRALVGAFAASARRAREAGFDAIELQYGLGYLIAQFLSDRTNRRADDYGGDRDRRDRFAGEVAEAVLQATEGAIPIIARISATDQVDGGLQLDDAIRLTRLLDDWGISAVHVVTGSACDSPPWYYQHMGLPDGVNEGMAAKIKSATGVPTIVAGRLGDPERIEEIIGEEQVDMIAIGRPLVADPDLPQKMAAGRTEEILLCGSCLQGCLASVKAGKGIGCIVNPEVGHESEPIEPSKQELHVVVVGGGPAGLTTSLVARRRGFKVTLLERNQLGGQFSLAPLAPGKSAMARPLNSLLRLVNASGADIKTGVEATTELVESLEPDVVVLATGAEPAGLSVPGLDRTLTASQVLTEEEDTGTDVLVVGGGTVGIEVAEFLASKGKTVTVIEMLEEVARDMLPITRKLTLRRLGNLPVSILTNTLLESVKDGMAVVRSPEGERELGPFHSIVVAVGTRSNNELAEPLIAKGLSVKTVGDAAELKQILGAVQSAREVACSI